MKKRTILLFLVITFAFISVSAMFGCKTTGEADTFRLIVPEDWELEVGDSRTIDYAFVQGVTNRQLTFSVSNKNRASVDSWGRVTALKKGNVRITAKTESGDKATVKLRVVEESKNEGTPLLKVDFQGTAVQLNNVLQKIVTRYPAGDAEIPTIVSGITDYSGYQKATTEDGAVWTITEYGVLRVDENAANSRDREQRFMGDRYFYKNDGVLLGIVKDGTNGIWTIMAEGVTHIAMVDMDAIAKADNMYQQTQDFVERRGMVSEATFVGYDDDGNEIWKPHESDNDGLWTSMYGAGELMRYASLKAAGASAEEIAEAKRSATRATEAVLLLSNLSMRTGTVETTVRYQPNAIFDNKDADAEFYPDIDPRGRYHSEVALVEGGDYSLNIPYVSPAEAFEIAYKKYIETG
ncbi:MAG: Ig-like domain-containing protein, partial [Clostridia bacterium]